MSNRIVTKDNVKIGDKVVRGGNWEWRDQNIDSVYGIIKEILYTPYEIFWVCIEWVNHKGITIDIENCRIGPSFYYLYFYEQ